jgi:hypothetical protein
VQVKYRESRLVRERDREGEGGGKRAGEPNWHEGRTPDTRPTVSENGTAAVRGEYARGLTQWPWNKQLDGFIIDWVPRANGARRGD